MQRVLFVLRTKAAVLENLPVAEFLRKEGKFSVEFLVDPTYVAEQVPLIASAGFPAFHPAGKELLPPKEEKVSATLGELTVAQVKKNQGFREQVFQSLPAVVRNTLHYHSRLRRMRLFLKNRKPSVIVLSGDRQLGWELACIKAANELRIPTLLTPYAIQFAEGIAVSRFRRPDYAQRFRVTGFFKTLVARFFPDLVFLFRGERMFYYPLSEAFAAWVLKLLPSNPWTIGGGDATKMAVESAYAKKIFLEDRIPEQMMVITGKPCNDQIFQEVTAAAPREVRKELRLPADQKMLLCSVPQLAEHGLLSWEEHLHEVEYLLSTFASLPNVCVVLSLHPKSDLSRYQALAGRYSAVIAPQRIYVLQPACDVFVAGVSSTVTQAIGIGKPTVVIDYFGLDDRHYYDKAPGVTVVRDRSALKPTLEYLLRDEAYYESRVTQQQEHGKEWAIMDGKCTERVVHQIEALAR